LDDDEGTKALGLATLDVLARSELARKEELELFDIAWKNVSGDENGVENGQDSSDKGILAVDAADDLGDNKRTEENETEEVGQ